MSILSYFDQGSIELRKITKIANKVDALSTSMKALTDEQLQNKTNELKQRLTNGETLDDILVEAYAVVREASVRVTNKYPFLTQIIGGIAIHRGNIAEMKTGEGKTLTSVFPAYLNALAGEGVHIVTVNEYLAAREAEGEIGDLFRFLGLTVGLNIRDLNKKEKQEVYRTDILYSTNNELGFDYLRDNMVQYKEERVQRPLSFAIIDEVDSILIDEARTPLIISGGHQQTNNIYMLADRFSKSLKADVDYIIDEKTKSVTLTDEGVNKAERSFGLNNLYELKNSPLVHRINQAMKANFTMKNDVDYVVQDNEIVIVDQFTGRLMKGRAYSDGLHQAIEAKEGVTIKQETRTLATITFQNYFRMYKKLAGMTGTAKTEEEEFREIYNMYVVEVPTNRPIARIDSADLIYSSVDAKYKAIVNEIAKRHANGQPVLVGTIAIETSELISTYLTRRGIKHEVLNAKNHAREAEIIAHAGEKGAVTIATNMAGRGTDIKLGEGVLELGGLCVIGTERHESRRIDNQLRGRSGRQGDAGFTQFYISLQDELMIRFGSDNLQNMLSRLGFTEEESIQSKIISKSIESAQKRVEGNNYDVRKRLLQYDEVLRQQREIVYARRNEILDNDSISDLVVNIIEDVVRDLVHRHLDINGKLTEKDYSTIVTLLEQNLLRPELVSMDEVMNKDSEALIEYLTSIVKEQYEEKKQQLPAEMFNEFEKVVALRVFDQYWMNHIDAMAHLKEGIYLRSYAQENPLRAYTLEGFEMFDGMFRGINFDIARYVLKSEIRQNLEREEVEKGQAADSGKEGNVKKAPAKSEKVGRNELCTCGSGKKYKHCCGK